MIKGLVFTLLICLSLSQAHGSCSNEPKTYTSSFLQYVPLIVTGYTILRLTRFLRQPTNLSGHHNPATTITNTGTQAIIFGITNPLHNNL